MARPLRFALAGATYHIFCRGNRKDPIFFSDRDYSVFLKKLDEALIKYECFCYTFCLMPNHYHLYLKTLRPNISDAVHHINSGYSNWLKAKRGIIGHVFQGRFGSILVDDSTYALFLSSYIHLNPVRAHLCDRPGIYPWSSYESVCGRRKAPINNFDREFVLGFLHPDPKTAVPLYEKYVMAMMCSRQGKMPITQRAFLGSDEFARKIRAKFNAEGGRRENPRILRRDPTARTPESILSTIHQVMSKYAAAYPSPEQGIAKRLVDENDTPGVRTNQAARLERKIAIYFETKLLEQTLGEIGRRWGMDYGAVAQLVHRMEAKIRRDGLLASLIAEAEEQLLGAGPLRKMSNVKT